MAMIDDERQPSGPRGLVGAAAEDAAAAYLQTLGWSLLARNVHVGRDEVDVVAVEPLPGPVVVFVEVRSRSTTSFGAPEESVDSRKVNRLYRSAMGLTRVGRLPDGRPLPAAHWRIDLVTMWRDGGEAGWQLGRHLRGLTPP